MPGPKENWSDGQESQNLLSGYIQEHLSNDCTEILWSDIKLCTTSLFSKFSYECYVCEMEKKFQSIWDFKKFPVKYLLFLLTFFSYTLTVYSLCLNTQIQLLLGAKKTALFWNSNGLFKGQCRADFYHWRMKRKKLNQDIGFFTPTSYNDLTLNHIISDTKALMRYSMENFMNVATY